jgi:hypothetical protein
MNLLYLRRALERFRSGVGGPLVRLGIAGAAIAWFCVPGEFGKSEHAAQRHSRIPPCANQHQAHGIDSDRAAILPHLFGQLDDALTQSVQQLFELVRMVHACNSNAEDRQRNGPLVLACAGGNA